MPVVYHHDPALHGAGAIQTEMLLSVCISRMR